MSSRNYKIAFTVVAILGVAVWWALPGNDSRESEDSRAIPDSGGSIGSEAPVSSTPPPPVVVRNPNESHEDEPSKSTDPPRTAVEWPKTVLSFADRSDPDPTLSRETESAIGRSLAATLRPNRYEVPSITCRASSCQILSVEWAPITGGESRTVDGVPAAGAEWRSAVGKVMRDLSDVPIRDPGTSVQLRPTLQVIQQLPGEPARYVAVMSLEKP